MMQERVEMGKRGVLSLDLANSDIHKRLRGVA